MVLQEVIRENSFPCLFQLIEVTTFLGSRPHTPTSDSVVTFISLTLTLLPSFYKDPVITFSLLG